MKKDILQSLSENSKIKNEACKYRGIDVSRWQGEIDWKKVKESGIKFAMIRMGLGNKNDSGMRLDEYFIRNVREARAAGVDIGCYFYSYAHNIVEANEEAQFVIDTLRDYPGVFTYPIVLDLESRGLEALGKDVLTNVILAFGAAIEKAGYYFAFYSNPNWLTYMLHADKLTNFDLWLAEWKEKPTYEGKFTIWQYGVDKVNGINGDVDMDISYKNYPEIIKANGFNGFKINTEPDPSPFKFDNPVDEIHAVFCRECRKPHSCNYCDISKTISIVKKYY